jgi:hypothetical protein
VKKREKTSKPKEVKSKIVYNVGFLEVWQVAARAGE